MDLGAFPKSKPKLTAQLQWLGPWTQHIQEAIFHWGYKKPMGAGGLHFFEPSGTHHYRLFLQNPSHWLSNLFKPSPTLAKPLHAEKKLLVIFLPSTCAHSPHVKCNLLFVLKHVVHTSLAICIVSSFSSVLQPGELLVA